MRRERSREPQARGSAARWGQVPELALALLQPRLHTSNYSAAQTEPHPCQTCRHYGGPLPDNDINCFCQHPRLSPVVGQPENGCAFWEREAGIKQSASPALSAAAAQGAASP